MTNVFIVFLGKFPELSLSGKMKKFPAFPVPCAVATRTNTKGSAVNS